MWLKLVALGLPSPAEALASLLLEDPCAGHSQRLALWPWAVTLGSTVVVYSLWGCIFCHTEGENSDSCALSTAAEI